MLCKSDPSPPSVGESYFATCERDDEGHCKPKGDGGEGNQPDKPAKQNFKMDYARKRIGEFLKSKPNSQELSEFAGTLSRLSVKDLQSLQKEMNLKKSANKDDLTQIILEFVGSGQGTTAVKPIEVAKQPEPAKVNKPVKPLEQPKPVEVTKQPESIKPVTQGKNPKWGLTGRVNGKLSEQTRPEDLTSSEAQAIRWYTGGSYLELNSALQGRGLITPEISSKKMLLQSAFAKTKVMKNPVKVYRGLDFNEKSLGKFLEAISKGAKSGEVVTLPGFQSTTTDEDIGFDFNGNVVMEIEANQGIDVSPVSDAAHENELLLNHNCGYQVISVGQEKQANGKVRHKIKLRQLTNGKQ